MGENGARRSPATWRRRNKIGGASLYARAASGMARLHDVAFIGDMMIAEAVERDWLANAIVFVSAASRRAVEAVANKLAEDRDNEGRERLRASLVAVFRERLALDVFYSGRSTKRHTFAAMVRSPGRIRITPTSPNTAINPRTCLQIGCPVL